MWLYELKPNIGGRTKPSHRKKRPTKPSRSSGISSGRSTTTGCGQSVKANACAAKSRTNAKIKTVDFMLNVMMLTQKFFFVQRFCGTEMLVRRKRHFIVGPVSPWFSLTYSSPWPRPATDPLQPFSSSCLCPGYPVYFSRYNQRVFQNAIVESFEKVIFDISCFLFSKLQFFILLPMGSYLTTPNLLSWLWLNSNFRYNF